MNYRRMRENFGLFDIGIKSFTETVQMAEEQQRKRYAGRFHMFNSDEQNIESLKKAQNDIAVMDWEEILELAVDYEVGIDFQIKSAKEEATDWELQEDKRMSKLGF